MVERNSHIDRLLRHFPATQKDQPSKNCKDVIIEVVNSSRQAVSAVDRLIERHPGPCKAFGLDCEWDIVRTKGTTPKPDLLQIATPDGYCVLFRLSFIRAIPPELRRFLENPAYIKVGVAVQDDTQKLHASFGVTTNSVLDVRYLADEEGLEPRGLSVLAESVLGESCPKHNWRFHHNWTGRLSEEHKRYAAIDAIMGVKIFAELNHRRICKKWGDSWKTWSDREYNIRTTVLWADYFNKLFEYHKSKFIIGKVVDDILRLADLRKDLAS